MIINKYDCQTVKFILVEVQNILLLSDTITLCGLHLFRQILNYKTKMAKSSRRIYVDYISVGRQYYSA